jgi:hypothetical protein
MVMPRAMEALRGARNRLESGAVRYTWSRNRKAKSFPAETTSSSFSERDRGRPGISWTGPVGEPSLQAQARVQREAKTVVWKHELTLLMESSERVIG